MRNLKSYFVFFKKDRSGIFVLITLILSLQCVYFFFDYSLLESDNKNDLYLYQREIDSLSKLVQVKEVIDYKFNPNYISDYKGYSLGMTVLELDRLHKFRSQNKYINTVEQFQHVTKVSDSLLNRISKSFRFPSWVKQKYQKSVDAQVYDNNINTASVICISGVSGISVKLVSRIVNFRNSLRGFVSLNQLYDVYGLSPKDAEVIMSKFELKTRPVIKKINVNFASASELANLVYINTYLANNIIEERVLREGFKSLDELKYVKDFPLDRLESIKLYLIIN